MKTLKELGEDLKELMIELQSDAHNKINFRPERYNNLKLSMDVAYNPSPHVVVTLSMSSAEFDLKTLEKINGGLGPDDKFVARWFAKPTTIPALMACWRNAQKNRGKIYDKYKV